jgi:hypothetical protein
MKSVSLALTVSLLAALLMAACGSPEATRMRGGGPGADVGNRAGIVQMHEGSQPFLGTPRRLAERARPTMEPGQPTDRLTRADTVAARR